MRGEWVESFGRPVGGSYKRFAGSFGRGLADVRAYGYARVIHDASALADPHAVRGR